MAQQREKGENGDKFYYSHGNDTLQKDVHHFLEGPFLVQ